MKEKILKKRVGLLYEDRSIPIVISLAICVVIASVLWQNANPSKISIWLGVQIFLTVIRLYNVYYFKKKVDKQGDVAKWEWTDVILTGLSGANWGVGLIIFCHDIPLIDYTFILILSCGVVSGAATSTAASKYVSYAFIYPVLTGFGISTFIYSTERRWIWIGLVSIFIYMLSKQARKIYIDLIAWTKVALEKEDLANSLEKKISLEKQLHKERSKRLQEQKMASIGHMAKGMAHEIFNPLTIVNGKIELIKRCNSDGEKNQQKTLDHLEKIESAAKRIHQIVDGLVRCADTSHIGEAEEFDVNDVLMNIFDINEERLGQSNIKLIRDFYGEMIKISMNKREFTQVIMHLLNNAEKAVENEEEKWIYMRSEFNNGKLRVAITDSGPGVSKINMAHIFNPFYTTKQAGEGPGLGLSISKNIIEKNSGKLQYNLGSKNSEFVIIIPVISDTYKKVA